MVATRENSVVITQRNTIKKLKHTDTKRHQMIKRHDKKQGTTNLQNNQKTMNKMSIVSPYLLIITLNINK